MSSCACWIPAVTSLGTLVLYSVLLLVFYVMLSRKIAQHSCGMQASSSSRESPSPHPSPAPASSPSPGGDKAPKPGAPQPGAQSTAAAAYAGSSDTSSDTSEDSEEIPSCPQVPQGRGSEENINYSSLVFPGKGHGPGSAQDYENVKAGLDYVNVDPKRRKIHFWPFSSPRASKGVEYTEVKL